MSCNVNISRQIADCNIFIDVICCRFSRFVHASHAVTRTRGNVGPAVLRKLLRADGDGKTGTGWGGRPRHPRRRRGERGRGMPPGRRGPAGARAILGRFAATSCASVGFCPHVRTQALEGTPRPRIRALARGWPSALACASASSSRCCRGGSAAWHDSANVELDRKTAGRRLVVRRFKAPLSRVLGSGMPDFSLGHQETGPPPSLRGGSPRIACASASEFAALVIVRSLVSLPAPLWSVPACFGIGPGGTQTAPAFRAPPLPRALWLLICRLCRSVLPLSAQACPVG